MHWQEIAALGIVGSTTALMLWYKFRPRKFSFHRDTHCGCTPPASSAPSIIIHGRRGERPTVTVKSQ